MKKKIIYILMSTVIGAITFLILLSVTETATTKKFAIHPDEVRGWECWENQDVIIQMLMDMNTMVDATSKFATNGEITIKISAIGHIPMDTMKMQIADNVPLIESMLMEIMSLIIVGG